MDLKTLLFFHSAGGSEETTEAPFVFSAVGNVSNPRTTNNYGTTIDSLSAEDNSVTVTQVYNPEFEPPNYNNGYIAVGFTKIAEWIEAGASIDFSADIEITENPANVTFINAILGSSTQSCLLSSGKLRYLWNNPSSTKAYVEVRCSGCSFTLSNCKLTKV